jgi:CBS domain-containing protein
MIRVGDIVRDRPLLSIAEDASVHDAAVYMSENKVGAVPVRSGERLVGVFSERDIMTRVVVPRLDPLRVTVREVMTRDLVVAEDDESTEDAEAKMAKRGCRHLPVVREGELLGFLSIRDLLQFDLDERTQELAIMTHYVQYVPPEVEARLRESLH